MVVASALSALLLPDYCKYRLDSAGTKIANTTRPSLPIMYGSERARTGLQAILCVESLDAQCNQLPSGYVHLCRELFKRFLPEVATPNLDRSPIRPGQAGLTAFSRGAEEPDSPRSAVCASLALLHKHIFLIYPELQPHSGSLPVS